MERVEHSMYGGGRWCLCKAQGNAGHEGKEKERDDEQWRKEKSGGVNRGWRGHAKRLRLWLPLLSVCTEMSKVATSPFLELPNCYRGTHKSHTYAHVHRHIVKQPTHTLTHTH